MAAKKKSAPKRASKSAPIKQFGVGKYCVIRTYSTGVHAGILVQREGSDVVLRDSRRLWSWSASQGVALSGVAQHGLVASESKVDSVNPTILLSGVIEVIPASKVAEGSIRAA